MQPCLRGNEKLKFDKGLTICSHDAGLKFKMSALAPFAMEEYTFVVSKIILKSYLDSSRGC